AAPPAAVENEGSVWVYETSARARNSVATPSTAAPVSWPARASERRNAARQSAGCARGPERVSARVAISFPSRSSGAHHPLRRTRRQESLFVPPAWVLFLVSRKDAKA